MKLYLSLFALLFTQVVFSQIVNIPDPIFKSVLVNNPNINTNLDNEIQISEATAFSDSIYAVGLSIQNIIGIEAFVNLTFLSVVNNQISSIDVTQNTQLKVLLCPMNSLTTLDVSQNVQLERLAIAINPGFQSIDISNNINLRDFYCDNSSISALDLSNQAALEQLYCSNANLSTLDLSFCPLLKKIDCSGNSITNLNTTGCSQLEELQCQGNNLPTLDLSTNIALKTLRSCCNQMTSLDVSTLVNLEVFDSPFNSYTSLDLSNNPNLITIYCFTNQLTSLNVANGNNQGINLLWTSNNDLDCIQVDDPTYSNTNWLSGNSSFEFDSLISFQSNCSGLGIPTLETERMRMYPNPSADKVTLTVEKPATWTLYSLNGAIVLQHELKSGANTLDLSNVGTGIYFAHLTQNSLTSKAEKLVKL